MKVSDKPEGPVIKTISDKKLVGKSLRMSMNRNRTYELWSGFMPGRKEIKKRNNDLYSLQVYDDAFDFMNFNPDAQFEKWAAVEVDEPVNVPEGMKEFSFRGGLYAVFIHRGSSLEGERTFRYIFEKWLPGSGYLIDNRPHFEILGEKYRNNDPSSEEEIWIPVKLKNI